MSETKFCVNCVKYQSAFGAFGVYFPDLCRHSTEVSLVTGLPMLFVKNQGLVDGPTMLQVRTEMCKGDWFEEKPIDVQAKEVANPFIQQSPEPEPERPWWRIW